MSTNANASTQARSRGSAPPPSATTSSVPAAPAPPPPPPPTLMSSPTTATGGDNVAKNGAVNDTTTKHQNGTTATSATAAASWVVVSEGGARQRVKGGVSVGSGPSLASRVLSISDIDSFALCFSDSERASVTSNTEMIEQINEILNRSPSTTRGGEAGGSGGLLEGAGAKMTGAGAALTKEVEPGMVVCLRGLKREAWLNGELAKVLAVEKGMAKILFLRRELAKQTDNAPHFIDRRNVEPLGAETAEKGENNFTSYVTQFVSGRWFGRNTSQQRIQDALEDQDGTNASVVSSGVSSWRDLGRPGTRGSSISTSPMVVQTPKDDVVASNSMGNLQPPAATPGSPEGASREGLNVKAGSTSGNGVKEKKTATFVEQEKVAEAVGQVGGAKKSAATTGMVEQKTTSPEGAKGKANTQGDKNQGKTSTPDTGAEKEKPLGAPALSTDAAAETKEKSLAAPPVAGKKIPPPPPPPPPPIVPAFSPSNNVISYVAPEPRSTTTTTTPSTSTSVTTSSSAHFVFSDAPPPAASPPETESTAAPDTCTAPKTTPSSTKIPVLPPPPPPPGDVAAARATAPADARATPKSKPASVHPLSSNGGSKSKLAGGTSTSSGTWKPKSIIPGGGDAADHATSTAGSKQTPRQLPNQQTPASSSTSATPQPSPTTPHQEALSSVVSSVSSFFSSVLKAVTEDEQDHFASPRIGAPTSTANKNNGSTNHVGPAGGPSSTGAMPPRTTATASSITSKASISSAAGLISGPLAGQVESSIKFKNTARGDAPPAQEQEDKLRKMFEAPPSGGAGVKPSNSITSIPTGTPSTSGKMCTIVGLRKIPALNGERACILREKDETHWEINVKNFVAIVHKKNAILDDQEDVKNKNPFLASVTS
ncbi:unnamed protein product [Amoebophrya sp. A25]|nr:unnamed protein product [Amoebophrya sp. A25]|eukprot:GSA25T00014763001.1